MAGTNDFKSLATGVGANVLTQAEYEALASLLANGFTSGVADSKTINKALRQSSFVAEAIAKIIADNNVNALDNGDVATFKANLLAAILGSATTPPQFDNDTSLATTAFVQRALGNFRSDSAQLSVDTALTAADAGSPYIVTGAASNITLPTLASAAPGTAFTFVTDKVVSFKGNGAEQIHNGLGQSNSYTVFPGEALTIVAAGSVWNVVGHGFGSGSYATNPVANGYQKLPSGFIIQWGSLSVTQTSANTAGTASASFPIAFPNSCIFMIGVPNGVDNVYTNASASALTSSTYQAAFISQLSLTRTVQWIAFGR